MKTDMKRENSKRRIVETETFSVDERMKLIVEIAIIEEDEGESM